MSVLLLRLSHPAGGEQLAVRGFSVDRTDDGWEEDEQASCLLAREQEIFDLARACVLSTDEDPPMTPQAAGVALWNLIARSEVGEWWRTSTERAGARTVRTILDVVPEELQTVPWELMAPEGRAPVFRNERHPWVRARTPWQPLDDVQLPITVLVVVGDLTSADLDVEEEIAAVHGALRGVPGRWNVEVLTCPTRKELRGSLEEIGPDVLHVIAHGMRRQSEQVLQMVDAAGRSWPLRRQDVDEFPLPAPRLVVLNACRTANRPAGQRSAWTFCDAFVNRGAAAVVAMQGDIPSVAAAQFSGTFYAKLADGAAIDVSTALARRAVSDQLSALDSTDERSWALPFLEVAADPDRILPVRMSVRDEERVNGPLSGDFARVGGYIDRACERRQLWRALEHGADTGAPKLVLVSGQQKAGKSAMVLSALMTLRLRGRNVVYVDLAKRQPGSSPSSWLAVLRKIRDAIWYWVPETPIEPRQVFDHELWHLRRYREPEPWTPAQMRSDDGAEFESKGDQYHDVVERVFAGFHRMLRQASADEPLLIVLDGISGAYLPDIETWVAPRLIDPAGPLWPAQVSWVVVGTDDHLALLPEQALLAARQRILVERFKFDELHRLVREFFARQDIAFADAPWWPTMRQAVKTAPATGWSAEDLRTVLDLRAIWGPV